MSNQASHSTGLDVPGLDRVEPSDIRRWYARFRRWIVPKGIGFQPQPVREDSARAMYGARIAAAFEAAGEDVRIRLEPDEETRDADDLVGDCEGIGARAAAAYRKEVLEDVARNGVWGVVGEWRDADGRWHVADSCWGFHGYKDPADPCENAYVVDIMRATLSEFYAATEPGCH